MARLLIDERLFTNSQRIICHNLATVNDTTNTSSFGHHDHRTSPDKSYRRNDGEKCASHVVGIDVCLPGRVGAESPLGAVSASSIAEAISSISDTIQTSTEECFFLECFDSLPLNSFLRSKTTALASHLTHG